MIISNELQEAMKLMENLEHKFNNNEKLEINELDQLGLFYLIEKNEIALKDSRFKIFWFHHLYLIYAGDLMFKSTYYKINPNKRISDVIDYKKIQVINEKEYDEEVTKEMQRFRIENDLLIPIDALEVAKGKEFFEKIALEWATVCLYERATEENLKIIGKETRDTLRKKNIEDYISNTLNEIDKQDVFIGILKSYYIFYEATKILEQIDKNNELKKFDLNGQMIEFNFYSLIHIVNRHYGLLISPQSTKDSKTFHNTKIEPRKINSFLNEFFKKIKANGLENKVDLKSNEAILLNFYGVDYALFVKEYKYDKSKLVVETFFVINSENSNAERLNDKIKKSRLVEIEKDLSLYIKKIN